MTKIKMRRKGLIGITLSLAVMESSRRSEYRYLRQTRYHYLTMVGVLRDGSAKCGWCWNEICSVEWNPGKCHSFDLRQVSGLPLLSQTNSSLSFS